jgi:hypothetical protein
MKEPSKVIVLTKPDIILGLLSDAGYKTAEISRVIDEAELDGNRIVLKLIMRNGQPILYRWRSRKPKVAQCAEVAATPEPTPERLEPIEFDPRWSLALKGEKPQC